MPGKHFTHTQTRRGDTAHQQERDLVKSRTSEVTPSVEELRIPLAELWLWVKKQSMKNSGSNPKKGIWTVIKKLVEMTVATVIKTGIPWMTAESVSEIKTSADFVRDESMTFLCIGPAKVKIVADKWQVD